MADHSDLRIEQANAAIHSLIQRFPDGRIPAEVLPEYERLLGVWLDAVRARDDEPEDDVGDVPLAA